MTIYTSEKVMPYVYMGIHKQTGEFYIGSRANKKQKLPSHQDIYVYRTSSKRVRPIFDEFDWFIVAEFLAADAAYDFEQSLIYEHWDNPLKLNGGCFYQKGRFSNAGKRLSDEQKLKISAAGKGRVCTEATRQKIIAARTGQHRTDATKRKMSEINTGKVLSDETRQRMSAASKGVPKSEEHKLAMRKPRPPRTAEHRAKLSEALKGRKLSAETKQKMSDAHKPTLALHQPD